MPYVYSVHAAALIRQRALGKRYVVAKYPGADYVQVARSVSAKIKAVAKLFSLHRSRCAVLGLGVHSATQAAVDAKPVIGYDRFKDSWRIHRAAKFGKHRWADSDIDEEN